MIAVHLLYDEEDLADCVLFRVELVILSVVIECENVCRNLYGQRVQKAVKGLYIIDGKKIIVK